MASHDWRRSSPLPLTTVHAIIMRMGRFTGANVDNGFHKYFVCDDVEKLGFSLPSPRQQDERLLVSLVAIAC